MINKENTLRARSLRGIYTLFYWACMSAIPAALIVVAALAIFVALEVLP